MRNQSKSSLVPFKQSNPLESCVFPRWTDLSPHWAAALLSLALFFGHPLRAVGASALSVGDLRCENLTEPLGVDAPRPRLSWVSACENSSARGQSQSGYQVVVATSQKLLDASQGDLWDSGRTDSSQSSQVAYAGKALASEQECFWKVRVWDQAGKVSRWSKPAHWGMGLLESSDWKGQWIGQDETEMSSALTNTSWIWFPEGHPEKAAPIGTRYFRRGLTLPAGTVVKSAHWLVTGDNEYTVYLNGKELGNGSNFKVASDFDVTKDLQAGKNVLAATVKNTGDAPNPAGLLGILRIECEQGEPIVVATDDTWAACAEEIAGWSEPGYDDSTWLPARILGDAGIEPWGKVTGPEDRRLPARWLRKEFAVRKDIRRATVYFSGLGLSELYLNGQKISPDVLSPALSEYSRRAFYRTYDVTAFARPGANAVGVILGNGRFFAPRIDVPTATRSFGFPKLLFQMRVEFTDGSSALVVSDASWKLSTEGPIRANNEYDGEEYDARLEMPGWSEAGFNDSQWRMARLVSSPAAKDLAPGLKLSAQSLEPIRVTETLKPVAMTEPKPGVYIFDMGQNMVGWCRVRVSGPRGTQLSLRHAETLNADGTLYVANLRSAKVRDVYTLKGQGAEVYEPRFTYHGFRFVEVTGYPGRPELASLEGRVVNDALESAGDFACSSELLNRIYRNIRWGVRGNYRSIPTDCPQRDERQGWLGDRSAESAGETYLFNTEALYTKWLQDMADAQKDNGSVPDVCPAYWPIYSDNVTWPSSTVLIPAALRRQFGDRFVVEAHYASAKKWMEFMAGFVTNGLIGRDSYGDWCVPPEEPKLIHSNDPQRKTDKTLLATAYFYEDTRTMEAAARELGKMEDARHWQEQAATLKSAFNRRFLHESNGVYDNGSQTSCVLPLAFGLIPDAQRALTFQHLLSKIENESKGHIGTGLIGGQWLMRVLSDNGSPNVAWQIATQKTYPSWGYMTEKNATTIWELWNGDTADPAMNSGNHVMLVGDLVLWLFEDLAGIKPVSEDPGFKRICMRPEVLADLKFVKASHRSPFGWITSDWRQEGGRFRWSVTVPVNTVATLYVPAKAEREVRESGHRLKRARGVRFLRMENGRAVLEVDSGSYSIESRTGT